MTLPTRKRKKKQEQLETEDDSTGGDVMSPALPGQLKQRMPASYGETVAPHMESIDVRPKIVSQRIQMMRGEYTGQRGIIVSETSNDRDNPIVVRLDEDDYGVHPGIVNCTVDDIRVISPGIERRRDSIELAASLANRYGIKPSKTILQLTARDINEWADSNNIQDIGSCIVEAAPLFYDTMCDYVSRVVRDDIWPIVEQMR